MSTSRHQLIDDLMPMRRLTVEPFEIFVTKGAVEPHVCELFLDAVRTEAFVEVFEIDEIEVLVLIKAGKDKKLFAGVRVDMPLQALGADLLHHALHGRVDRTDRDVLLIEIRLERGVPGLANTVHHAVRADGDDAVDVL